MSRTISLAFDIKTKDEQGKDIKEIIKDYGTIENPLIKEIEIFDDFNPILAHDDEQEKEAFKKKLDKFNFKPLGHQDNCKFHK